MEKKQPGKKIKCSYLGVRKLLPEYGQVGEVQMGLAHEVILTNYVLIINLNIESHQRHLYCRIRRNCRKYFYLIFSIILPFLSPMSRLGIFSILRNGRLFWETLYYQTKGGGREREKSDRKIEFALYNQLFYF